MKFKIETDLIPKNFGAKHDKNNWESPISDKMNNAYEILESIDHHGYIELYFDSLSQEFTVNKDGCRDITQSEADSILNAIS